VPFEHPHSQGRHVPDALRRKEAGHRAEVGPVRSLSYAVGQRDQGPASWNPATPPTPGMKIALRPRPGVRADP
jgi:hypothetical protein